VNLNLFNAWGFDNTVKVNNLNLFTRIQAMDALSFSLGASYSRFWRKQDQWVTEVDYNGQQRVIVSGVDQNTLAFTLRFNYNVTPDLTIQYYGQPFITRPKYQDFGYVAAPLDKDFDKRFVRFSEDQISFESDQLSVDENLDGTVDYSFGKPDFNFVQFRSNLVVRWEYIAGSELFLVWSQANTPNAFDDLNSPLGSSLFNNIFDDKGRNIFLVKMTYRFLR
jgi:hypothetical protein